VLVNAGDAGPELLRILNGSRHFRVADFDERAAVEFAAVQDERARSGIARDSATRAKAKFDDQIIAIATVENATAIYSDDDRFARLAGGRFSIEGILTLPLPPEDAQPGFVFDDGLSSDEPEDG
jgi:hypothetical protein